jgi:hypothetical protein
MRGRVMIGSASISLAHQQHMGIAQASFAEPAFDDRFNVRLGG